MLIHLAALGVGIVTLVTASSAAAHEGCDPAHSRSHHPNQGHAAPSHSPAPPSHAHGQAVVLARADYNRDGGITLAEAHAYGRAQFGRADLDRNGVLTRRELRGRRDEFARGARADGVVTYAEYDARLHDQFHRLDRNRDRFLSSYELGGAPPRRAANVGWSWRWSL